MTWRHRYRPRHHGPPPFVRRAGCFFALLAGVAIVSLLRAPDRAPWFALLGAIVVAALAIGFAVAISRVSRHLQAQDRLRRQLMADVAHELRTPLAILQGRLEGFLDGVYPRDDANIEKLAEETRHLSRLVEDLRTLANAEAGALDLRKEPTDLAELIRDAARSLDTPIEVDVPDELPPIEVDPVRIREVLLNLLSNAIRHKGESGTVTIRAEARAGHITVRVIDTGAGIAAEELPRIFDRFTKGRTSEGSGLGLAIARNLVLAHGVGIHAESRVGEGTTITVTF